MRYDRDRKKKEDAIMDIRYSVNQRDFKRYTTDEIRDEFLITDLFKADEVTAVYSHVDFRLHAGQRNGFN